MKLIKVLAVAFVAAFPLSANAVILGQLDLVGNVNPSDSEYTPTGQVDLYPTATATIATGVFDAVVTIEESLGNGDPTVFEMFDLDFGSPAPQMVFLGGGFSFTAESFDRFDKRLTRKILRCLGFRLRSVRYPAWRILVQLAGTGAGRDPRLVLVDDDRRSRACLNPAADLGDLRVRLPDLRPKGGGVTSTAA
jgi:hypothetical protein